MKLKPCPFDGSAPMVERYTEDRSRLQCRLWRVYCPDAFSHVTAQTDWIEGRAAAIRAWNTRKQPKKKRSVKK